jgi:hypothetical protein
MPLEDCSALERSALGHAFWAAWANHKAVTDTGAHGHRHHAYGAPAIYFQSILDIEPFLFQPIEQKGGVRIHDLFRLVDSRHGALVCSPAHPLWLRHEVPDATVRPELAPQLECAPQGPIMSGFALAGIGEPVGPARREGEGAPLGR